MASVVGRARLSCVPCRKRKSKCDEAKPCSSCVLRGTADRCVMPSEDPATAATSAADDAVRAAAAAGLRVLSGSSPSDKAQSSSSAAAQPSNIAPEAATPPARKPKKRAKVNHGSPLPTAGTTSHALPDTPMGEVEFLRASLGRLETLLQQQQTEHALTLLHPSLRIPAQAGAQVWATDNLPERGEFLLARLTAVLPCRFDCEVLLEFLFQEADWLVPTLSPGLALNVWSRTVWGGRITHAEAGMLCALLSIGSLFLSECGPHPYYRISVSPAALHIPLLQYALEALHSTHELSFEKVMLLSTILVYLVYIDQRSAAGLSSIESMGISTNITFGLFNETASVWASMDPRKAEWARRLAWQGLRRDRYNKLNELWTGVHGERTLSFADDFNVNAPQYDCLGLDKPFLASADGLPDSVETTFVQIDPVNIPRLFRHKGPQEQQRTTLFVSLLDDQSGLSLDVCQYLEAVASWTTIAESTPHRGSDEQREQLLRQCEALRERIEQWGSWVTDHFPEGVQPDEFDILQCRQAAQASLIHSGLRHLLSAIYRPWLARDITTEDPSALLLETQLHALGLARANVKTLPATRTLVVGGLVPFFVSWVAVNLHDAATTLAIPLLAHARRPAQPSGDTEAEAHDADADMTDGSGGLRALLALHGRSSSRSPVSGAPISSSELRTLASDLLCVLDTLLLIAQRRADTPTLSATTRDRVVVLVERFRLRDRWAEHDGTASRGRNEAASLVAQAPHATGKEAHALFDDVLALNDSFWETLLSAPAIEQKSLQESNGGDASTTSRAVGASEGGRRKRTRAPKGPS